MMYNASANYTKRWRSYKYQKKNDLKISNIQKMRKEYFLDKRNVLLIKLSKRYKSPKDACT